MTFEHGAIVSLRIVDGLIAGFEDFCLNDSLMGLHVCGLGFEAGYSFCYRLHCFRIALLEGAKISTSLAETFAKTIQVLVGGLDLFSLSSRMRCNRLDFSRNWYCLGGKIRSLV